MPLNLLPIEESGNPVAGFLRTAIRPVASWGTVWDELQRGTSPWIPLGFAYTSVAVTLLLALAAGWAGLQGRGQVAPGMVLAILKTIPAIPGILAQFIALPFLALVLGGPLVHGVFRALGWDSGDPIQLAIRVLGYAFAWMVPLAGLATASMLYLTLHPEAWIHLGLRVSTPSEALWAMAAVQYLPALLALALTVGGLRRVYGVRMWQAVFAALLAFGALVLACLGVQVCANLGGARAVSILSARQKVQGRGLRPGMPLPSALPPPVPALQPPAPVPIPAPPTWPSLNAKFGPSVSTEELRSMAMADDAEAMAALGQRLVNGNANTPRDPQEGVRWLMKSYASGFHNREVCTALENAFGGGAGVPRDLDAVRLWRDRGEAVANVERGLKEPELPGSKPLLSYRNREGRVFVTDDPAQVKALPGEWRQEKPR